MPKFLPEAGVPPLAPPAEAASCRSLGRERCCPYGPLRQARRAELIRWPRSGYARMTGALRGGGRLSGMPGEAIGILLRKRREELGFPLEDLAATAELAADRVQAIEAGARTASILDLEKLGRALVFDPALLVQERRLSDPRRLPGWFQSHGDEDTAARPAPADIRHLLLAADLGRIGAYLLRTLYNRQPRALDLRRPSDVGDAITDGKRLGVEIRQRLQATGPVESMQRVLEDLDVHVAKVSFQSPTKAAVSIIQPGALPVVLLNATNGRIGYVPARRATLAHEFGHILFDSGERHLDGMPTDRGHDLETRANNFSPNFIAPPSLVREDVEAAGANGSPGAVVLRVAQTWGMSLSGAAHHAANVGLISKDLAADIESDKAWRQANAKSLEDPARWENIRPRLDAASAMGVTPNLLVQGLVSDLVVRACEDGHITRGRAREILRLA